MKEETCKVNCVRIRIRNTVWIGNRCKRQEKNLQSSNPPLSVNETWLSRLTPHCRRVLKQPRQNPLTEGSVLLCHSTNLRMNYLIDQTGAPQRAALCSSKCAVACSIFRLSEMSSSKFSDVHPGGQKCDSLSPLDNSTRHVRKCAFQNQSVMQ